MPWTEIPRAKYRREWLRYASDISDGEWLLIAPLMPLPKRIGRPRQTDLRAVMNAIQYMVATGCQWRQLPKEFPPNSTAQEHFYRWSHDVTWALINRTLVMAAPEHAGRDASPTAGVIDSQSVKTMERRGPRGFNAGNKFKGSKRHMITDTEGHLVGLGVHPADIRVRDGADEGIASIRGLYPWLQRLFPDGGDADDKLRQAVAELGRWTIEIITRFDTAIGVEVLPRQWVVERTFAWLGRCRLLAKYFGATIASDSAWIYVAHIRPRSRHLASY